MTPLGSFLARSRARRRSHCRSAAPSVRSAVPARADTITVTNTADDGSATSLRGVLENVTDGDDVVLTAGATYQLTICEEPAPVEPRALEGTPGDVEIDGAVTIVGNGATIEQTCDDRVLFTEHEVTLQDVTVTGGDVEGPAAGCSRTPRTRSRSPA
jgi:hypothetical protein